MKQEADTERTDENATDVTVGESWLESSLSKPGKSKIKDRSARLRELFTGHSLSGNG